MIGTFHKLYNHDARKNPPYVLLAASVSQERAAILNLCGERLDSLVRELLSQKTINLSIYSQTIMYNIYR